MNVWGLIVVAGLVTYATRLSFIALLGRFSTPAWLTRVLRFVPPAVLSAIIVPDLLLRSGRLALDLHNARLVAGVAAVVVAWRSKNALLTIGVGMLVLWLWQAAGF